MKVTKEMIVKVIKKIETGSHLNVELPKIGISTSKWYKSLQALKFSTDTYSKHRPLVYTKVKAEIVRARVKKGEFIKDVCVELGMEYMNFCRFCRRNGIKIMTKALLKANYKRRGIMSLGKKKSKKKPTKKATKKRGKKK